MFCYISFIPYKMNRMQTEDEFSQPLNIAWKVIYWCWMYTKYVCGYMISSKRINVTNKLTPLMKCRNYQLCTNGTNVPCSWNNVFNDTNCLRKLFPFTFMSNTDHCFWKRNYFFKLARYKIRSKRQLWELSLVSHKLLSLFARCMQTIALNLVV